MDFVFKGGSDYGKRLTRSTPVVVGSSDSAGLVVSTDPLMAPEHFCVERLPDGGYRIRNLSPRQGTFLDGRRIDSAALYSGALIRAGLTVLQILFAETPSADNHNRANLVTTPDEAPALGDPSDTFPLETIADRPASSPDLELQGTFLSGCRLLEEIGRGTFGRVCRAVRETTGEVVAIKIFDRRYGSTPKQWARFLREMEIHRCLHHPHIVALLGAQAHQESSGALLMEYVEGTDLRRLVRSRAMLSPSDAVAVIRQVLTALEYAHHFAAPDGPFVHRDVKPSNILIAGVPGQFCAKLCDFGLSKNFERAGLSGMTATGSILGTLEYMSPEQVADSKYMSPSADLHAAGGVLYFALTGQSMYDLPPRSRRSDLIQAIQGRRIVPLRNRRPDLPAGLDEVIRRATGLDMLRRFHSARQMIYALEGVLTAGP